MEHHKLFGSSELIRFRYIGDAKNGVHVGTDQMGNRYYENMNPSEEVPGMYRSFSPLFVCTI